MELQDCGAECDLIPVMQLGRRDGVSVYECLVPLAFMNDAERSCVRVPLDAGVRSRDRLVVQRDVVLTSSGPTDPTGGDPDGKFIAPVGALVDAKGGAPILKNLGLIAIAALEPNELLSEVGVRLTGSL